MHPAYQIASLTGAVLLLTDAVPAVERPVQLLEIPVNRFTVDSNDGERWTVRGLPASFSRFLFTPVSPTLAALAEAPAPLYRWTPSYGVWVDHDDTTPAGMSQPQTDEAAVCTIGLRVYRPITLLDDANIEAGQVVNLATRAKIAPGGEPVTGSFVIEGQHRRVLIRGVGPALETMGVSTALENPHLVVHRTGTNQFQLFNDDWGQRYDADVIEQVSAQIGAFPLARGSQDAVILYEFEPGAYTIHLGTDSGATGTALLEVYVVPSTYHAAERFAHHAAF